MPKPVRRIRLDESRIGGRALLVALVLLIAALAFGAGLRGLTAVDSGWTVIEADAGRGLTAAQDFQLRVDLGRNGQSPLTERKRITALYTEAARDAYVLYQVAEQQEETHNLWWINHHPNEDTEVDPRLYRALKKAAANGRFLYLGPVYELADTVSFSATDGEAALADVRLDEAAAGYLREALRYVGDEEILSLSFPGENTVRLNLSEDCLAFGRENGITRWLDLGWQKNAYIADDLAEALAGAGITNGVLTSADGFIRCLDEEHSCDLVLNAWRGGRTIQVGIARCRQPAAMISLLPVPGGSRPYAYRYQDGTLRSAWISPEDGLDHCPVESLTAASAEDGCADLVNRWLPLLTGDAVPASLPEKGDSLILCVDGQIRTGGGSLLSLVDE